MGQPTTAVLDIDKIHVEEGFNARKAFDEEKLNELAASIKQNGLVTALTVRKNGGSDYVLIAGERRLIAAKRAGLKELPVLIRDKGNAFGASLAENEFRDGLNPIERAEAMERLRDEEKLKTQKELAKRLDKSSTLVSQHLRLLKLPKSLHPFFADGTVPIDAERNLRLVAKASVRAAECCCELVANGSFEGRDLLTKIDDVLLEIADGDMENPPTLLDPHSILLSEVVTDKAALKKLKERSKGINPYSRNAAPLIRLGEQEIDAARAAGCLLDIDIDGPEFATSIQFITDKEMAADLADRRIARHEKSASKAPKAAPRRTTREEKAAAELREEEREHEREVREAAQRHNEEVGRLLINRRRSANGKQDNLVRAQAVAAFVFGHGRLAPSGLRLVLPQLRDTKPKKKGSKGAAETVAFLDYDQTNEYVWKKVMEASSDTEVIRIISEAMVASSVADREVLPRMEQVAWSHQDQELIEELLAADIKAVTPAGSGEQK